MIANFLAAVEQIEGVVIEKIVGQQQSSHGQLQAEHVLFGLASELAALGPLQLGDYRHGPDHLRRATAEVQPASIKARNAVEVPKTLAAAAWPLAARGQQPLRVQGFVAEEAQPPAPGLSRCR
jgi:hypothetical protein